MSTPPDHSFDNKLFLAGGLVTLVLTFSALLNLNNQSGLISLLLFLPIPIYFIFVACKKVINQLELLFSEGLKSNIFFNSFSFKEFFLQTEVSFLVSLLLLSLSLTILMYQTSFLIKQ